MRRLLLGVLAAGMLLTWPLVGAGTGFASAVAAPQGRQYVALGDSVTQFGSASGLRYPERFFAYLQQAGAAATLQNIGVPGETSSSILGTQLTQALQLISAPDTNTTVVTLDIGGNDVLGSPSCNPTYAGFSLTACQPTLSTFATNYKFLLDQLDAALTKKPGPHQVIVMPYYNPWSGRPGQETTAANAQLGFLGSDQRLDCHVAALGLNDLITCIRAQHGALVADVYPTFIGKGAQWFADVIHPNDLGHAAIASVFASVFGQAAHPIHTLVSCTPGTVLAGTSTHCTARVRDTARRHPTTPTGTVGFTSSGTGQFSADSCTLSGHGRSASCSVSYTPTAMGRQTITASYGGDGFHHARAGTTSVTAKPSGPLVGPA